jgi:hypothetical protein
VGRAERQCGPTGCPTLYAVRAAATLHALARSGGGCGITCLEEASTVPWMRVLVVVVVVPH